MRSWEETLALGLPEAGIPGHVLPGAGEAGRAANPGNATGPGESTSQHRTASRSPGPSGTSATSRAGGRRAAFSPLGRSLKNRDRESRQVLDHLKRQSTNLWQAWERLSRLDRDLRTLLPGIQLRPLKLEKQVLIVTAPSSALAARVRQYEPRLLDGLQARGWLVSRIRFRATTLSSPPSPTPPRPKAPVPTRAVDAMAALAAHDDLSPALKAALENFVRRQRGYHQSR